MKTAAYENKNNPITYPPFEHMDVLPAISAEASEQFDCDIAFSDLHLEPLEICISHIKSRNPSNGNGTRCLLWVLDVLKNMGFKRAVLMAVPLGIMTKEERSMKCERLIGWYRRSGFEVVEYNYDGMYLVSAEMEMTL